MASAEWDRLARALQQTASRLADPRPILRVVGIDMVNQVKRGFATGTAPDGGAWRPLSDTTKALRRHGRRGSSEPLPLRDTGRLMRSIVSEVTQSTLAIGTNLVYAKAQNFGNPANRMFGRAPAPIPQRRFMPTAAELMTPARRERVRQWLLTGRTT